MPSILNLKSVPICRLIEDMVLSGLVVACLLATRPYQDVHPFFEKPTTEGVIPLPFDIGYNNRFATFHYCYNGVGSS